MLYKWRSHAGSPESGKELVASATDNDRYMKQRNCVGRGRGGYSRARAWAIIHRACQNEKNLHTLHKLFGRQQSHKPNLYFRWSDDKPFQITFQEPIRFPLPIVLSRGTDDIPTLTFQPRFGPFKAHTKNEKKKKKKKKDLNARKQNLSTDRALRGNHGLTLSI